MSKNVFLSIFEYFEIHLNFARFFTFFIDYFAKMAQNMTTWPPSSPDCHPMDFAIWSILESRACKKRHRSLKALRMSLRRCWRQLDAEVIRRSCAEFQGRLEMVVEA